MKSASLRRACSSILAVAAFGSTALAQAQVEEVIVTGSRIRQNPLDQASPVIQLNQQDIDRTGLTSLGDLLQRLPVSGGALNTKFNSSGNFGFPPDGGGVGAGAAAADLRYLGSKRVLVLVDGQRWINESSASGVSSATDLNTIPVSIIERIDVLEDGASAIYGSDALSGVINIITKKDFEGLEVAAYTGGYDEGDGETSTLALSFGSVGERTRNFFSASYLEQRAVLSSDRTISQFPTPGIGQCTGGCSSGTPQGRFFFTDPNTGEGQDLTINDAVGGIPNYDPTLAAGDPRTDDFHDFATADRFNFAPFNYVLTPSERIGLYGQSEYQLADGVSFYVKGLYNNRKSTNQAAPEPIFIGPEAGNGNLLDTISVDVTNPYNPFGFTLDAATNPYFIGRRPLEGGPRIFSQDVDTWYFGGGFQGEFQAAERNFYWDVNAIWSRNRANQETRGSYNSAKILQALGPAGVDGEGNFVCGVPDGNGVVADPIFGCVPLNLFGGQGANGEGTITQEMLDWIRPILRDVSEQELIDYTVNLSGTLFDLPAGGLDFAVGFERREQQGSYQPDAIVVAGESAGVPSTPTSGEYDVNEFYGEIQVPLLRDAPLADLLQISAAARSSDYSTFGSETTTRFGANWRPVDQVLLRATFAEGLRAPGIGELFGSAARFDQTLTDPCSDYAGVNGINPPAPADIQANCAALGIPNTYVQFNPQISVTTGGNRELTPETSDSWTYGLVYGPSWAEDTSWSQSLSFEFTYYDVELDDAIQAIDAQVQLNRCASTLDAALCSGISRTPGGVINQFANQLVNIGGIETKGYDVTLRWASPETGIGTFTAQWLNSFLDEYTEIIPAESGFQGITREGTERGDPEQAYPEWKSTFILDWALGDWSAGLTVRYIDSVTEACVGLSAFPGLCSNPNATDDSLSTNELDATTYVDLQLSWAPQLWDQEVTVTVGINNVTDEDPPFCFSCALNGFDATTYDVPGMFWYGRVTAHFGQPD